MQVNSAREESRLDWPACTSERSMQVRVCASKRAEPLSEHELTNAPRGKLASLPAALDVVGFLHAGCVSEGLSNLHSEGRL